MNRIVRIARDLRIFASPHREQVPGAVTDVQEVVESAISLTRGRIFERAKLVTELAGVPPVMLDNRRLVQVIVNLLVHATQSVPTRSEVAPTVKIATRAVSGQVEIEVSDNGAGIPRENLARIWTPFFTTKDADIGSGLGLSISREIIEGAGGTIRVESPIFESDDGPRGSRFVVSLPAAGDAEHGEAASPVPPSSAKRARRRMRLLVVEDETAFARALTTELGTVHDVVHASSAEYALEVLSRRRFDVVLCDLRMPGMSGEVLYERVRARDPLQARQFIFMSGIGFVPEVEHFLTTTGRPVLQKPFSPSHVLELISEAIDAPPLPASGKPTP
jgi:CheY-like chemotaxis protein